MFEKSKGRYLTRGVDAEIPIELQVLMWQAVDQMPEPKDYLQVFRLSEENGLQIVHHTSEQPLFEMTYIVEVKKPVTAKVYIIDDGEHCTMLLAEEYERTNTSEPIRVIQQKNPSHTHDLDFFYCRRTAAQAKSESAEACGAAPG